MSLKVPAALLEQAEQGAVREEDFLAWVRESLPYAWGVGEHTGQSGPAEQVSGSRRIRRRRSSLEAQGQLLRTMASDAMRGALERHFGVRVAFQNCHRVGVFGPGCGRGPVPPVRVAARPASQRSRRSRTNRADQLRLAGSRVTAAPPLSRPGWRAA